jgi:hypothetical protein
VAANVQLAELSLVPKKTVIVVVAPANDDTTPAELAGSVTDSFDKIAATADTPGTPCGPSITSTIVICPAETSVGI